MPPVGPLIGLFRTMKAAYEFADSRLSDEAVRVVQLSLSDKKFPYHVYLSIWS